MANGSLVTASQCIYVCSTLKFPRCGAWKTDQFVALLGVQAWLVLIHVGKTGGMSLLNVLAHTPDIPPVGNGSGLPMRLGVFEFHVMPVRPPDVLGRRCVFMARDPVARFVSAFNYAHPNSSSELGRRDLKSVTMRTMYWCFEHVDDFAAALRNTRNRSSAFCASIATFFVWRFNLTGHSVLGPPNHLPLPRNDHLSMGLAFYYGAIISLLPSLQYALVETETLQHDTLCILATWFPYRRPLDAMPTANAQHSPRRRSGNLTTLQPQHHADLRKALATEYAVLDQLRRHTSVCSTWASRDVHDGR